MDMSSSLDVLFRHDSSSPTSRSEAMAAVIKTTREQIGAAFKERPKVHARRK